MSHYIQELPMTSFAQEIKRNAHARMQCIWIQFVGGIKSLYDFVICLHEPHFDRHKLQNLSDNARKQISIAAQDIANGEVVIKEEIDRLVLKKQKIEREMVDTNSTIISLTQMIRIIEDEIGRANNEIQSVKKGVKLHEENEKKAKSKATVAKICTAAATVSIVTVLTAGTAAPAAATAVSVAVSWVSAVATGVTHCNLNGIRKALQEKTCLLQEHQKDLKGCRENLNDAQNELKCNKEKLIEIAVNNNTNHDDLKVITKLKVCISQCHDFINITLGRVEILSERKKKENYKPNLKMIMNQIIEQISNVSAIEEFSNFIHPVESMAIEMRSLCNQQAYQPIKIESNDDEEMFCCWKKCCCVFYSCIG
ncbi:unnamed protein product [Mytilus edulis]|uniref:Uncharacterized protein n=1 Tax=Mytilus edulis TaxID=6550 RepID=A0A8S3QIB4_MYTED|nr:unnamed protein product [Mytilus edulis]